MKAYIYDVFHRCDSITDWTTVNCSLALDSTERVEGNYSIKMTAVDNANSSMRYDRNVDWSGFTHIAFWVYHPGCTNERGDVRLYSSATDYDVWNFEFGAVWTEIILDLSDPDSSFGSLDLSDIDYIKIWQIEQTTPGEDYYFDFIRGRTIEATSKMNNCRIHDGILPYKKKFTFTAHPTHYTYFNIGNYIDVFDDTPTLRFSGWIKSKPQKVNAKFECPGLANEVFERTYDKSYTTDNTKEKLQDITTNALSFCSEGTYDATATDWSYEYNRACVYMFWLARWMEKQVPYIKPDGEIMVIDSGDLTASGESWTLGDGNQNVMLIDIPVLNERIPGYYKGNTGITSVSVRYINNTVVVRPATPSEVAKTKKLKEFRDPKIQELATAQQIGDNLYAIFALDTEFIGLRGEGLGWLQPGETVEIENTKQITIAKAHRLLQRVVYDPKNDIHHLMIFSNNIITPREFKTEFDTSGQQIHTAVLQSSENQATLSTLSTENYLEYDDDDAAGWDIEEGNLTIDSDWHECDLDTFKTVPSDAIGFWARVKITDAAGGTVYADFRATSQSNAIQTARVYISGVTAQVYSVIPIPLDANHKFDYWINTVIEDVGITVLWWIRAHT